VITTVQKVIPIFLLRRVVPRRVAALLVLGWPLVLATALGAKCLKKILILSSVFFLLSLVVGCYAGGWK